MIQATRVIMRVNGGGVWWRLWRCELHRAPIRQSEDDGRMAVGAHGVLNRRRDVRSGALPSVRRVVLAALPLRGASPL